MNAFLYLFIHSFDDFRYVEKLQEAVSLPSTGFEIRCKFDAALIHKETRWSHSSPCQNTTNEWEGSRGKLFLAFPTVVSTFYTRSYIISSPSRNCWPSTRTRHFGNSIMAGRRVSCVIIYLLSVLVEIFRVPGSRETTRNEWRCGDLKNSIIRGFLFFLPLTRTRSMVLISIIESPIRGSRSSANVARESTRD